MCTLVVLRRPDHDWPLLVAGNRDEMRDRPWLAPGRHWEDRPEVVAGLDRLAGGSWFGVNDYGVVAVVMNREGSLGPQADKRSRGELVLEALDHAEAAEAAQALAQLDTRAYRSFNLFVGDPVSAFWLRHSGGEAPAGRVEVFEVTPGLHMLAARDLDDVGTARIRFHLPRFRGTVVPDPASGQWNDWPTLLASRAYSEQDGPHAAMNIELPNGFADGTEAITAASLLHGPRLHPGVEARAARQGGRGGGFGTVCSHLVAVPRYPDSEHRPVFLFAGGPPDRARFEPVVFDELIGHAG